MHISSIKLLTGLYEIWSWMATGLKFVWKLQV